MKPSVLVIDDSENIRQSIIRILKKNELFEDYLEAGDGLEGFKLLIEHNVDMVICDIVMPGFDGFKFLGMKSSKPEFTDIPVILLTSKQDIEYKIRGLEQGASDYITKPFDPGELIARVKVHLKIKSLQDELKKTNEMLRELSVTDGLTKIYNRRYFMDLLKIEFSRAEKEKSPLTLIMMDLDYFKKINDTFGHLCGDQVLLEVCNCIKDELRKSDIFGRYGGEEFTLLCPETKIKGGEILAERIRKKVRGVKTGPETTGISISCGLASIPDASIQNVDQFIMRADEALYRAKALGRDRIELSIPVEKEE